MLRLACILLALPTLVIAGQPSRSRGTLAYQDGNRITGMLVADGEFESDRFGRIRFVPSEATFTPEIAHPGEAVATAGQTPAPESPQALEASRNAGHGREPPAKGNDWKYSLGGFIDRTIEDQVSKREYYVSAELSNSPSAINRYDAHLTYSYISKGAKLDKRRATATGKWEHDVSRRWFTLYRPYGEYDGVNLNAENIAALGRTRVNYLLTQQQAGLGLKLVDTKTFRSSVVMSWSYFYLKVLHFGYGDANAPALRFENTATLPWGLELKQEGQIYYGGTNDELGWENQMDLTKRFNDKVYLTLRHEYRKDYPLLNVNAIDRIRLILGLRK